MSNSKDSGSGRNCSGPRLLRSRDFDRLLVGLNGTSGSMANDDRSFFFNEKENSSAYIECRIFRIHAFEIKKIKKITTKQNNKYAKKK